MSSAILYLAIIAIWAGFLVPAWVRRPHARPDESAPEQEFSYAQDSADGEAAEYPAGTESSAGVSVQADVHVEVSEYADDEFGYYEAEYHEEQYVAAGYDGDYETEPRYAGPQYAPMAAAADPADDAEHNPGEAGYDDGYAPQAPRTSQSREQMLHARRRMLAILAGMTFVTVAFTALGLVSWWICVPPAGLLVLYVLLLREIALADAELARKRSAWEHARAVEYERHMQAVADSQAYEASLAQPEPEAEIIDISGRVADADQLYDQYADATVRAVGD